MAAYLTFLLDLGAEGDNPIVEGSLSFEPDPARLPRTAFVWKVTCDARGLVVVRGLQGEGLTVIATAQWDGSLDERAQRDATPTVFQWDRIQTAMEHASAARKADPSPYDDTLVEDLSPAEARSLGTGRPGAVANLHVRRGARSSLAPRPRLAKASSGRRAPVLIASGAIALVAIGGLLFVRCSRASSSAPAPARSTPVRVATPRPPPPPPEPVAPPRPETLDEVIAETPELDHETLAGYRVRWSDVDVASQTTLAKVEKDPAAEKGKRVCAEGTLERITKTSAGGRTHYTGSLVTAEGDRVVFLVGGSSGELLKRDAARLCGVVTGTVDGSTQLFGMFDLPENRDPVVEMP